MITPEQMRAAFSKIHDPSMWSRVLAAEGAKYGINTPLRFAAWLAQCGHESAEFNTVRENLSYSARALMKTWPARFPTIESTKLYERQPETLANFVYSNRLGNGDTSTGDGWRFRGGGLIQLTGRANYLAAGVAIEQPLMQQPQKIETKEVAARTAAWFWKTHGCNELADTGSFGRITQVINGGMNGAGERLAYFRKLKEVLRVSVAEVA